VAAAVLTCFKCGAAIPLETGAKIALRDACPECDANLHCCRNCRFYSPGRHNDCEETQAEWVRYKDEANHCDYFQPVTGRRAASGGSSRTDMARKKFDDLFKN
jgi:hypothetical protein